MTGLPPDQLRALTDEYLFGVALPEFLRLRGQRPHGDQLDWTSDGCTDSPDRPFGWDFLPACQRHDFGYANFRRQGRFTEENRRRIDGRFHADMYEICHATWSCRRLADVYYQAVRRWGARYLSTAAALARGVK
ncbi:phospholipase [Pseudonocardiaceae bacterium YIM PH 21723]|nr:phospholipase [Pseudonocardiaceae bacterium YIM PH 21723]